MPTQNGKRRTEESFIASLLSGSSIAKAAADAGVSERTAYRWLENEEFQKQYRQAKAELVTKATNRVIRLMDRAARTMVGVMTDKKAPLSLRLRAATRIYDRGQWAHEIDNLSGRVEELERQFVERRK